jgi:diaminopropionate ammonia-lyase
MGVQDLRVKDEGRRFGLESFKALGASYAMHRWVREHDDGRPTIFATATDGNHGRAVAWTASALGHRAVIFVPRNTVPARIEAIRREGAEVRVVDGTYDETVRCAAVESAERGWQVISDTAYAGYTEIPRWIMAGYETIFAEATDEIEARGGAAPTIVFLQAGVGGLACAGCRFYARRLGPRRPAMVTVEPMDADCLLASITSPGGEIRESAGRQNSIMAGLNCGTASPAAWPSLRLGIDLFLAVDDGFAEEAMRRLASGAGGDPAVVAGESGAAGLAGLLALAREPGLGALRDAVGLGRDSRVLLINTEGATDPVGYRRIVGIAPPA